MDFLHNFDNIEECNEAILSIFEVNNLNGSLVVVTAIDTNRSYFVKGLPYEILTPGMIISGAIGRKNKESIWTCSHPECVFPLRAKKYLENVKLGR